MAKKKQSAVGGSDPPVDDVSDIHQKLNDPLDPRKVSLDIFENYCQEMLNTDNIGRRAYLIVKMRYLIDRLIRDQSPYGRLYNFTRIANIVARVCARHPTEIPDKPSIYDNQLTDCLVDFHPDKWMKVITQFQDLRESLLRNDATLLVLPCEYDVNNKPMNEQLPPDEDDSTNEQLECIVDFNTNYDNIIDRMKFHLCMSHLQPQLHNAIKRSSINGSESVVIPHDNIIAFVSAIEEQFDTAGGGKYRRILNDLLGEKKGLTGRTTRNQGMSLKSFSDIEKVHSSNARLFDLELFQTNFLDLIRSWTKTVLPVPALSKLNYGTTTNIGDNGYRSKPVAASVNAMENVNSRATTKTSIASSPSTIDRRQQQSNKRQNVREIEPPSPVANSEAFFDANTGIGDEIESLSLENDDPLELQTNGRKNLKRKVKEFMKNVKDPLNDCVAAALSARAGHKVTEAEDDSSDSEEYIKLPPLRQKKKKAYQLKFDSPGESDNSVSEEEEEGVALSDVPTKYAIPKYQPSVIHVSQKVSPKKRNPFTDAEDDAIRKGVEELGAGNWAQIKSEYAMVLRNRSSVNIKDRWRNMNK